MVFLHKSHLVNLQLQPKTKGSTSRILSLKIAPCGPNIRCPTLRLYRDQRWKHDPNQTKVRFKIASGVHSSIWNSTFWTCGIHAMKWQRAPVLNNLFLQTLLHKVSLWYGLYHVLHTWRRSGYARRMEKQGHNHHINPCLPLVNRSEVPWGCYHSLNPNTLMSRRTKSHHQQNTVTLIQLYIFCANSQHSSPPKHLTIEGPSVLPDLLWRQSSRFPNCPARRKAKRCKSCTTWYGCMAIMAIGYNLSSL